MNLVDELERLSALHRNGALSDEEFARAKDALLDAPSAAASASAVGSRRAASKSSMETNLEELRYQSELARIDREWELERQQYLISTESGGGKVPEKGGLIGGIVGALFGLFWTVMMFDLSSNASKHPGGSDGVFDSLFPKLFPLFGVLFIALCIYYGVKSHTNAQAYEQAYRAYQARRRSAERKRS